MAYKPTMRGTKKSGGASTGKSRCALVLPEIQAAGTGDKTSKIKRGECDDHGNIEHTNSGKSGQVFLCLPYRQENSGLCFGGGAAGQYDTLFGLNRTGGIQNGKTTKKGY